jgi:hypothetical protein
MMTLVPIGPILWSDANTLLVGTLVHRKRHVPHFHIRSIRANSQVTATFHDTPNEIPSTARQDNLTGELIVAFSRHSFEYLGRVDWNVYRFRYASLLSKADELFFPFGSLSYSDSHE